MTSIGKDDWGDVFGLRTAHGFAFLSVYAVYGYQVCPYLETLTLAELVAPAAIAVLAQIAASSLMDRRAAQAPIQGALRRSFCFDVVLAILLGVAVASFNYVFFGFPVDSGLKVLLAFSALGFFAALDCIFEREIRLARRLRETGRDFPLGARFLPFQTKFVAFTMINLAVCALIIMLIVLKDVAWILEAGAVDANAKRVVLAELLFVLVVLGCYVFRVIGQYARKTELALSDERAALRRVASGDFNTRVTVSSCDEFGEIAYLTNDMIGQLSAAVSELRRTRDVTIDALVSLAAARDNETGRHIVRTKLFATELAKEISGWPKFKGVVDAVYIARLASSAPLHDIGKVGVPDAILGKPAKLTDEEFAVMKTHATVGGDALAEADRRLDGSSFLSMARDIARSHHERWDGKGYPDGLAGEEIPLAARIMAVADVYDALRARRVYKEPRSHEEAAAIILDGRGSQFDPDIVDAFVKVERRFIEIARRHCDEAESQDPPATKNNAEDTPGRLSAGRERTAAEASVEATADRRTLEKVDAS